MDKEVSWRTRLGFAIGFMGTQLYNGTQAASTAWFWLNIIQIPNDAYSLIMLVFYNIWNAVNDPIFAHLSDRTRTRWGRRIPWLRAFAPIWWVFFVLLYFPLVQGQISLIIWFLSVIMIYDMCYTIVANNYNTLMPEISTNTKERTLLNTWANVFGLIANGLAYLFPLLLRKNVFHFQLYVVIIGGIATCILMIPSIIVKERPIPEAERRAMGFFPSIKAALKNRPFLAFAGTYFMKEAAITLIMANLIFFATHILDAGSLESTLLLALLMIMSLPGFALWGKISFMKGTKVAMGISSLAVAVTMVFISFVPSTGGFYPSLIIIAGIGFCIAGPMQFGYVMLAESVDYDEIRTNTRREGIFYGTNALLTKPGIGIGQAILSWILGATGFVADAKLPDGTLIPQPQPETALIGIRLIQGVLPAIFMFASLIFVYLYPLTVEATKKMKADLTRVHEAKFGQARKDN